ncbi:dihydrolipoamide acetyltransferase family protein [Salinibacterium sp. ZJ454]|uniref:dihydrolipoamide acetyltransferase family protein n=1 Tax=Salinibacterium sp. ZJ454 TaxID=2708339 RepID=UPI0014234365|nr:dihydrolipoamide acetyltransferase family protein [Salinibacterium sp. ZJ454]
MTAHTFRLPDLGEGLTEAALVTWLVAVGDTVATDQPIAEVETAKSVVEVPTPFSGTVVAVHGSEGETLTVGAPLLEVDDGVSEPAASAAEPPTPPDAATSAAHETYRQEEQAGSGNVLIGYGTAGGTAKRRKRTPLGSAQRAASPAEPVTSEPVGHAASAQPTALEHGSPVPVISPIVRKLALSEGIDLHRVRPTGAGGVITRADVLASRGVPAGASGAVSAGGAVGAGETDERTGLDVVADEPLSIFRLAVSQKLSRSRREIPEATVWVDVDATRLWKLRARLLQDGERMSLTAFLAKFTLLALEEYPVLAGRLSEDGSHLTRFTGVNLGIATDTPRGLMVPVIRNADRATLLELDAELQRLGSRAREGSAQPSELTGSTFTLNNYGAFDVDGSAAIINHPEVALLGVGRMIEKPWVVKGKVRVRRITQLALVFDHRVCDGGYAAGFLSAVKGQIERPERLLLRG